MAQKKEKVSVYLVDDHDFILDSLDTIFADSEQVDVIGRSNDSSKSLNEILRLKPDVVLVDLNMPKQDGLSLCEWLIKKRPKLKLVAFTGNVDLFSINEFLKVGGTGYLTKSISGKEIVNAILRVNAGEIVLDDPANKIYLKAKVIESRGIGYTPLTEREREILQMLDLGLPHKEIAKALNIAKNTVSTHCRMLYKKMDADSQLACIKNARQAGFIPPRKMD